MENFPDVILIYRQYLKLADLISEEMGNDILLDMAGDRQHYHFSFIRG